MGLRLPAAFLAAALPPSALRADAPDPAATVTATVTDGKVVVEYRLPQGASGKGVLYRSFQDLSSLKVLDLQAQPISRYDLGPLLSAGPGAGSGRFVDSLAADGTDYWYYLQAKDASGRAFPCRPARVALPPRVLPVGACAEGCHLFVDKSRYILEVRRDAATGPGSSRVGGLLLKRYPVSLGRDPVRRKLHQDNATTPEGTYRISYLKPVSQFHKAYGIDYPNAVDRERYARALRAGTLPRDEDGVPGIGGWVQIHGGGIGDNWTWGCMAMRNEDIDELFAQKGLKAGTAVHIAGSEVEAGSFVLSLALSAIAAAPGFDPATLRNGDILFQTSRSGQSLPIQLATRSPWSHCGIVYIQDGRPMVYEASGKVKLSPLRRFIRKGEGGRFEVKRLASADSLLTPENLRKLKAAGKAFDGRPYDSFFGWADDRIYCSELVFKMYRNALGLEIGVMRKLREFDVENPVVASALAARYGKSIPLEEPVIAPSDMYGDPRLVTIFSNFPPPDPAVHPVP